MCSELRIGWSGFAKLVVVFAVVIWLGWLLGRWFG